MLEALPYIEMFEIAVMYYIYSDLNIRRVHYNPNDHRGLLALEAKPFPERLPFPVKGVEGINSLFTLFHCR